MDPKQLEEVVTKKVQGNRQASWRVDAGKSSGLVRLREQEVG